ncbi:hypothetical protein HZ326_6982 [Fusarium oxysporum f. sp. albedinis]|nr:hypothetical protein HZ326_6982 [Fusarium oxysporum f. sp. albedinis]
MLHRVLIACLLFGRRCHTDFEWAGRQRLINHIVGTIIFLRQVARFRASLDRHDVFDGHAIEKILKLKAFSQTMKPIMLGVL